MRKNHVTTLILILVLIVGLSLLLYPTFADWWNSMHQSRAVAAYSEQVAGLEEAQYDELWSMAQVYNQTLLRRENRHVLTDGQKQAYETLLNVGGTGIMGYVEIPSIKALYPIYHGTDEAILQVAIGHVEWSSLPVGGEGTHCVISGHNGLPSAKLFTNLYQLVEGDLFMLQTLDETLTYEVDQILIVLPHETEALDIAPGKDYCTLVTCTPYGINTHRMLVRGHRVETAEAAKAVRVTSNAIMIEPLLVAPVIAAPILLILLIILLIPKRPRYHRGGDDFEIR